MTRADPFLAVREACIQAMVTLESHGVPLPPEGDDRVDLLERLHDCIAVLVDGPPRE